MSVRIDPTLFLDEAISEETRAVNERIAQERASAPATHELPPEETRARREAIAPPRLDHARERTISGPGGEVALRIFTPERVAGVHLYIHGGGWVLGRADAQDGRLWDLATTAHVAVVSVDYRLAPEHPFPAGLDDCEAAALWLREHAGEEFGSDILTIGGGSAGAHLAAATLIRLRDRFGDTGFSAADLVFGVYDLGMTPSQIFATESPVIPTATMAWFYDQFVADAARRRDPDVSPLYANLRQLPSALFTVGTLDPLLDDSLFMAQRWAAAGNAAELAVYPGGLHAFTGIPGLSIGAEANARSNEFIAGAIGS